MESLEPGAPRAEIQTLRAVAVLVVVVYHLWPGVLPGGFVGVDVFFAISGFLITGHLLREVERTRADLARRLLGSPCAAAAARRAADAALLRARDDRARPAAALAAVPHGDRREHGIRAELAARRRRRRLPRCREQPVAGPAFLVAVRRGAVLPRVAAADRVRDRRRRDARGDRDRACGGDRVQLRLLARRDGDRSGGGVLRDSGARVGVRRRRAARSRGRPHDARLPGRRRPVLGAASQRSSSPPSRSATRRRSPAGRRCCPCSARLR